MGDGREVYNFIIQLLIKNMYGIIGYPLSHSFSPAYFSQKFRAQGIPETYKAFPLTSIDAFPGLLRAYPGLKGLNVTLPYKETIIPFLDEMDATARSVGAVNCIKISKGRKIGFNTDVAGFKATLAPLLATYHNAALILGTGGAAKAVAEALRQLSLPYLFVSRNKKDNELGYEDLNELVLDTHKIIVNTTPLGMAPHEEAWPPIPYESLGSQHLLYDLIYNPSRTLFLKKGGLQNALLKNGYDMLLAQAEASWAVWQGQE